MPKPKIREVLREDLKQIAEIEKASFKDPYPLSLLGLLSTLSPEFFLVAEYSGRIVGYASALLERKNSAHLVSLAVHPDYRRLGVARGLMEALIEKLRARGVKEISLEVRVSNKAARELYKALGFREEGIIEAYYEDGENAITMRKTL